MTAVIILVTVFLFVIAVFFLYFICSPMPVVRLLRKGMKEQLTYPEGFELQKSKVTVKKDMEYASAYGRSKMDLYLPAGTNSLLPVVVWVHGGAFVAGSKDGVENWAVMLASQGLAVAAMEYQLAPEAHYPAQIHQICECCHTLSGLSKREGRLDMNRVILAGDSAGAHMAAQAALVHTNPQFAEAIAVEPELKQGALKGLILFCGPYDVKEMTMPSNHMMRLFMERVGWSYMGQKSWRKNPLSATLCIPDYINESFPPSYLSDGNTNSFEKHSRRMERVLREKGVRVSSRFFDIEKGQVDHEYQFTMNQPQAEEAFWDVVQFLRQERLLEG